jgi:hypothetical protein
MRSLNLTKNPNNDILSLKNHSKFNEFWVRDIIANDPSILGLGDLVLKDKERIQPKEVGEARLEPFLLLAGPDLKGVSHLTRTRQNTFSK